MLAVISRRGNGQTDKRQRKHFVPENSERKNQAVVTAKLIHLDAPVPECPFVQFNALG
jgi:hypothetical protein